jgi:hypothetical protein
MGWIGGKQISLADVGIAITTRNATVAVQSLDQKNISDSRAILISLGARSVPESGTRMPFHSEPVKAGGQSSTNNPRRQQFNKKSPSRTRTVAIRSTLIGTLARPGYN